MGGTASYVREGLAAERQLYDLGLRSWSKDSTPIEGISIEIEDVQLQDHPEYGERHIHAVWARRDYEPESLKEATKASTASPIICMHGYGSGAAIYYAALPGLAKNTAHGPVIAIDSLGCGYSARPDFGNVFKTDKPSVREVEDFFIDGIEEVRKELGTEKVVLVGHSIGGYLACAYSERHPEKVERLIVAGCAGLPPPPDDFHDKVNNSSFMMRTAVSLWERGASPFTLAKYGPGRTILSRFVDRRFPDAAWVCKETLKSYLYNQWVSASNSVGAYAHATLLAPGAYARDPLRDRIPNLKLNRIDFIYGAKDWMDPQNAKVLQKKMQDSGNSTEVHVGIVKDAGHNVMVDRPFAFVDAIIASLHDNHFDGRVFETKLESPSNDTVIL
eukprot:m.40371 g.40371  ORF g.40371 m.40371 type:complete len:388 (-) comp9657_c0_seq1:31-1194(-)